jgi:acetyl esterase/lipase
MKAVLLKLLSSIISLARMPLRSLTLLLSNLAINKNITYASGSKRRLDIISQKIDATNVQTSPVLRPVIVNVHGGGWVIGDKREESLMCCAFARQGYVVCSINYRLAPKDPFPAAISDCLLALQWVNKHIKLYGGDPKHIYVMGGSAGAHIASLAIATGSSGQKLYGLTTKTYISDIKGVILYYGVYNLRTLLTINRRFLSTYIRSFTSTKDVSDSKIIHEASPINFITSNFPPTLLLVGECDPLASQTTEFSSELKRHAIPTKTVFYMRNNYPDAVHGFQKRLKSRAGKDAFIECLKFLSQLK